MHGATHIKVQNACQEQPLCWLAPGTKNLATSLATLKSKVQETRPASIEH
jgi:hypothetical protein